MRKAKKMVSINNKKLEEALTKHLNSLSLKEVQKIFNQHLDYDVVASEEAYWSGTTDKYFSENNYGDLDKNKDWLIEQLIEGATNDYDGCATLGEMACQLGVNASENKDYEESIKLYDEPMERAIARELFELDQDQLRALLDEAIEHDELVDWHDGRLSETDLEERISEDKEWIVEEIILHTSDTYNLARDLRVRPQRRYLTVEVFGYDLNNTYDLKVEVEHRGGDEEEIDSDVIEMTDEDGNTL